MKKLKSGGGWKAIWYTLKKSREAGGLFKMYRALRTKNACKTCALGMGGQRGGMVNEIGGFPEVCKKSLQAMAADMQGRIGSEFWSTYSVEQLKKFTPYDLEYSGRLHQPLFLGKGETHYSPISWDEAFAKIQSQLKAIKPAESFWYFSGRSSNEAGFLLQLFARLYGTNNVNNCSYYCHQASGVGLTSAIGSGTASIVLEDVEQADLVFLIGGNPASNHPRLMTTLKNIRRKKGKVIVVNPVRETGLIQFSVPSDPISLLFGTKIATSYIQPHIGGDLAMLTGIAKRVLELDAADLMFMEQNCDGCEDWIDQLESVEWDEILEKSGLTFEEIDSMATQYAAAKNVVFCWTMGITHHAHGVQNVQAIANLAMMRGMIGRPGAGLLPIRGHSNVQGIGSVGVTPTLKTAIFENLEKELGVELPTESGKDTMQCMEAAKSGALKFGFCLGGNLYGSNPDSAFASQAMAELETLVYMSTTLNTGHFHGIGKETLILPVLARDEEPDLTTQESMFNFVRLSEGGKPRFEGALSEVQIISRMGREHFEENSPINWTEMEKTKNIRQQMGRAIPGFEKLLEIDQSKKEFQIEGRTFHSPKFATPNGKAKFHVHQLPPLAGAEDELRLMTVRSEGQFNTVVYENEDIYRGQDRRDVILLHPDDVKQHGLRHDQKVEIYNETGSIQGFLVRSFEEIRAGNALMYFPEANILVPRTVDPKSKTPAFKGVLIRIRPA